MREELPKAKICILGLGYIGLPTGSILATKGLEVLGVDVDEHVVHTINAGKIHIEEPGLETVVRAAVRSGAEARGTSSALRASRTARSCRPACSAANALAVRAGHSSP